jgi:hypothetical protein
MSSFTFLSNRGGPTSGNTSECSIPSVEKAWNKAAASSKMVKRVPSGHVKNEIAQDLHEDKN